MFWKRKARLTFPDVPPSLKTYPAVVRAVELGKRLAALCSEGTPQEVKAAYPDDKRQELIDLIDDDLDALAKLCESHPHLAPDIDPLARVLSEFQLYIDGF